MAACVAPLRHEVVEPTGPERLIIGVQSFYQLLLRVGPRRATDANWSHEDSLYARVCCEIFVKATTWGSSTKHRGALAVRKGNVTISS